MLKKICQFFSFGVIGLFLFASSAQASILYFDPVGGTADMGKVFPVRIHLKTTDPESVTSTSAYFMYPSDKVDIAYVKGGTAFPIDLGYVNNNGVVGLTRNNVNGVRGDVVVATVGLKPKVGNTSFSLQFIDGSMASQSDGTDTLDGTWTKSAVAQFNIRIASTSAVKKPQGGPDELPVAGLMDNTMALLAFGGGLVFVGGAGIYGSKRLRLRKNSVG